MLMEHSPGYVTFGHKTNLNKLKNTEIVSSAFSDNSMELEINYKKNLEKNINTYRLNDMLLNSQWFNSLLIIFKNYYYKVVRMLLPHSVKNIFMYTVYAYAEKKNESVSQCGRIMAHFLIFPLCFSKIFVMNTHYT